MGFGGNFFVDGLVSVWLIFCIVNKLSFKGREEIFFIYFFEKIKKLELLLIVCFGF